MAIYRRVIRDGQVKLEDIENRLLALESANGLGQMVTEVTEEDTMKYISHGFSVTPIITVVKDNRENGLEVVMCDVEYVSETLVAVSWNGRFKGKIYIR